MKAALEKEFPDIQVDLIKSAGGAFEIRHDEELIYSKLDTGAFPKNGDIVRMLADRT